MDIRSLTQFLEVARNQSYTKAAQKMFLAQPTLTKTIKGLESELDVKLFDHQGQRIVLTDYGNQLVRLAEPLVNEFNRLPELIHDIGNNPVGPVNVSTTPMLAGLYLVNFLPEFNNQYPAIDLQLRENNTFSIIEDVRRNKVDVGFCMDTEELQKSSDLELRKLFSKQIIALIHNQNPLSQKESISIEDLKDEKINTYVFGHAMNRELYHRCQNAGFLPQINFSSNVTLFLIRLTEAGSGITIMPKAYLRSNPSHGTIAVPFEPIFPWECYMILKKGRYLSEASRVFVDYAMNYFKNLD